MDPQCDFDTPIRTRSVSWANDDCLVEILGEIQDEGFSLDTSTQLRPSSHSHDSQTCELLGKGDIRLSASREAPGCSPGVLHLQVAELTKYKYGSVGSPKYPKSDKRKENRRKFHSLNDLKALVKENLPPSKSDDSSAHSEGPHSGVCHAELYCDEEMDLPFLSGSGLLTPCLEDGLNEAAMQSPSLGPCSDSHRASPLNPQPSMVIPQDEEDSLNFIFGELELHDDEHLSSATETSQAATDVENFDHDMDGLTAQCGQGGISGKRVCTRGLDTSNQRGCVLSAGSRPSGRGQGSSLHGRGSSMSVILSKSVGSISGPDRGMEHHVDHPRVKSQMLTVNKPDLSRWDRQWERLRSMIDETLEPSSI